MHANTDDDSTDPEPATAGRAVLEVAGLNKSFGGVAAIAEVDISVVAGSIHGLVGANGAGKSTLIRCLAGLIQPDKGSIALDGTPVQIRRPQEASDLGLSFIHQELSLVPRFTAAQNILLGLASGRRLGLGSRQLHDRRIEQIAQRLRFPFELSRTVDTLSIADQWLVSIGRALVRDARVIGMDEPTASLSEAEASRLLTVTRDLADDGIAVLYVSHRLDEILNLCDKVTVFRNGRTVDFMDSNTSSRERLIAGITGVDDPGGTDPPLQPASASDAGRRDDPPLLTLAGLTTKLIRDISLDVRPGEVVGLAGLVGSGRTEVARAIFGLDRVQHGSLLIDGREVVLRSPRDAVRHGIGLVPEERRSQALMLKASVVANLNLARLDSFRLVRHLPLLSRRRQVSAARSICERLRVKLRRVQDPVGSLSGGNQQKVVIGRWMSKGSRVLILDELSRGVDVGAREEIHRLLHEYAADGRAVLAISSEMEELVTLCDRIYIMREGSIEGHVDRENATEKKLIAMSYGRADDEEDL